jgi:hypothetical protein
MDIIGIGIATLATTFQVPNMGSTATSIKALSGSGKQKYIQYCIPYSAQIGTVIGESFPYDSMFVLTTNDESTEDIIVKPLVKTIKIKARIASIEKIKPRIFLD